jgi:hypothetical protein
VTTNVKRRAARIAGTVVLPVALVACPGAASASASGQPRTAASTWPPAVARYVSSSTVSGSPARADSDWTAVEIFPVAAYGSDAETACQAAAALYKDAGYPTQCIYTETGLYYWALLVDFPD